jgi:hypothetical protein
MSDNRVFCDFSGALAVPSGGEPYNRGLLRLMVLMQEGGYEIVVHDAGGPEGPARARLNAALACRGKAPDLLGPIHRPEDLKDQAGLVAIGRVPYEHGVDVRQRWEPDDRNIVKLLAIMDTAESALPVPEAARF